MNYQTFFKKSRTGLLVALATIATTLAQTPAQAAPLPPAIPLYTSPSAIAVGAQHTLYIADTGNNKIEQIQAGVATSFYQINDPTALTTDPTGNLYIASGNSSTITEVSPTGVFQKSLGYNIKTTTGLAFYNKTLYVADNTEPGITAINTDTNTLSILGTSLFDPTAVAISPTGDVLVASSPLHTIYKYTAPDTYTALSTNFADPTAIAARPDGTFAVTDAGAKNVQLCTATFLSCKKKSTASFVAPSGIAVDGTKLYITDSGSNQIYQYTTSFTTLSSTLVQPTNIVASPLGTLFVQDAATNTLDAFPLGALPPRIAAVNFTNIPFTLTANNSIYALVPNTNYLLFLPINQPPQHIGTGLFAKSIAITASGPVLYVATSSGKLLRYNTATGSIKTVLTGVPNISGLATGPHNTVYLENQLSGWIKSYTITGTTTSKPTNLLSGLTLPQTLTVDQNNTVYYTVYNSTHVLYQTRTGTNGDLGAFANPTSIAYVPILNALVIKTTTALQYNNLASPT